MAVDTTRGRQLQQLAQSLPGANQKVQQGLGAARQMQLQETVKQLAPEQATAQTAQKLGAQMTQAAGEAQLAGAQQVQNQQVQLGQLGLQQRAAEQREKGFEQGVQLSKQQMAIGNKLSQIDRKLKNELLDKQMKFEKDQAGRTLFNERQLLDWAVVNARNEEEFKNYQYEAQKQQERKMKLLNRMNAVATKALEQGYIAHNKPLNQQSQLLIAQIKSGSEAASNKAAAKARQKAMMWQQGGQAVGTGIGAIWGPVGAAVGGAIGSLVGGALGGMFG